MLQLGRIDEAIALFERLKMADAGRGYGALMRVRRFPDDVETLHRLERAARTPGFEGSVRTGLLFQLAAAWENRGRYDQAFALADEANTATRRMLSYDADQHRQRCARIRHAFPEALYQQRAGSGVTSTLPVFVVGMPRSGTTLVEQIIAGHSAIHGAGELGAIPHVIAGLERWERRTGSGRHYPDCVDDLDPTVLRGIAQRTLQDLQAFAPDASHVVDKLPHNFEHIGLIRLLFPNAKIISVRRDPRDIAISNYLMDYAAKHSGMGFAYDLGWIGEQLADHTLLMQHWHRVCACEILEINYEDLIDNPEVGARRMLAHIGVDWEPQVLDFHNLDRSVKTASVWQVRQPLYASSKTRWRRYSNHLQPLIAATNRRIRFQPIEMVTLPEPGWLNTGVDLFRRGDLDGAEYRFKQLLHHVSNHAAALYMLGLVYLQKGSSAEGVKLLEDALQRCPWNRHWQADLAEAYLLAGRPDDAQALTVGKGTVDTAVARPPGTAGQRPNSGPVGLDYLYFSEGSACASSGPPSTAG
jgi:tetratricopeptide (TPR) repeat protein